ncbi:MAG: MBL fold metallo-hydrolase [Pseudomonadota bacterium]
MTNAIYQQFDHGIACIDALYTEPGIACLYALIDEGECAIIETGTNHSVPNIQASLADLGVDLEQVRYVIPTHVHLDHAGGAGALMELAPNAELLIHPRGARHMIDPARLIASSIQVYGEKAFYDLYGEIVPIPEARVRIMEDGDSVKLGNRELRFTHLRGHADHHFCIFDSGCEGWFTGDMFGVSYERQRFGSGAFVMPATTPTQFEPSLYAQSIDRLASANPRRMFLTHYGELPFSPMQAELLKKQLDTYEGLGRGYNGDLSELEQQVIGVTEDALATLVDKEAALEEAEKLAFDVALNAQGIAWWANRQAS